MSRESGIAKARGLNPRSYSLKVTKILFGAGLRCAYPGCPNTIIEPASGDADAAVVGQVCHIYASSDNGPRGKPGLTSAERDTHENLILLCAHHHAIVDKQETAYPADRLQEWKVAQTTARAADATSSPSNRTQAAFYVEAADREIEKQADILRMSRVYNGFALQERTLELATRLSEGELRGGSEQTRGKALAFCARLLAHFDPDVAERLLKKAEKLAGQKECEIARAVLVSRRDRPAAIAALAQVDTKAARTAMFRILQTSESAARALVWFSSSALAVDDLDSDGRFFLIVALLDEARWSEAKEYAERLTPSDFDTFPALYHVAAMSHLMTAVPDELRAVVRTQVPFGYVPLSSEGAHLEARRKAAVLFAKSSDYAALFGVVAAANPDSDFALWLRLRDRDQFPSAREELSSSMRDPVASLRRVHLAIQHGVDFDRHEIEARIDRSVAYSGQGTVDEAFGRLSLALATEDPKEAAEALEKNKPLLYAHLNPRALCMVEVELLSRAGMVAAAQTTLDNAVKQGLSRPESTRLERTIAEARGADPVALRRQQYDDSGALADLAPLVDALEERGLWRELRPLAEDLYARTRAIPDGRRLAHTLDQLGDFSALLRFLESAPDLVSHVGGLDGLFAWTLYRVGRFDDARAALDQLRARRDEPSDRVLFACIAINSGRWVDLIDFTTREWAERGRRTAAELLWAGQLAQVAGGPMAEDLVAEAAKRAPDDASVLAGAYFHAIGAGWESENVGGWLARAAELSGDDGPIKSASFEQLVAMKPDWDQRASSTWNKLASGDVPLFGAANLLNIGLLELVLMPSLANLSERDTRRRSVIYAFSGARTGVEKTTLKRIAVDVSVLLTLTRLNLLERVVATYEILISHGTFGWLFAERQKATFHQPSRIREAHAVRRLVATGDLRILKPSPRRDINLEQTVGAELADLLCSASDRDAAAKPRVVRSAPVFDVGSMMQEEADLRAFAAHLCGCTAVVAKMRASGVLSIDEERRARDFLKIQERPWADEVPIEDGAELLLDSLSVHYLYSAGCLDKLAQADLVAFISPWTESEFNLLISREALGTSLLQTIDTMRRVLADGIASKAVQVTVASATHAAPEGKLHPTLDVLNTPDTVDAFLVDDRFVNRHIWLEANAGRTPLLTSLDLLDDLQERDLVTKDELFNHRTFLRRAGYQLVEFRYDELVHHIEGARTENGGLIDTAELKALREALLKVRMTRMLQIPLEAPWLHQSLSSVVNAIKRVWQAHPQSAAVLSEPLLGLLEVEGWAQSALNGSAGPLALHLKAVHTMGLMLAPDDVPYEVSVAYHAWFDKHVLDEIERTEPDVFAWLVDQAYRHIVGVLTDESDFAEGQVEVDRSVLAQHILQRFPPRMRRAIIEAHAEDMGVPTDAVIGFGKGGPTFQRSLLYDAVRQLTLDQAILVADSDGSEWTVNLDTSDDLPSIAVCQDSRRIDSAELLFLVNLPAVRTAAFVSLAARHGLPEDTTEQWRSIIAERTLSDNETKRFSADLQATPLSLQAIVAERMRTGRITFDELVPDDLRYYERLAGVCPDEASLDEYVADIAVPLMARIIATDGAGGYVRALLLGSHQKLAAAATDLAPVSSIVAAIDWAQCDGDLIAQTAILESLLARPNLDDATHASMARLVKAVTTMDADIAAARYNALAVLSQLVLGALAQSRRFAQKPPFWRRVAAFAHAALLERCVRMAGGTLPELIGALRRRGARAFILQSYVDLRRAPRGLPLLLGPTQLRNELGFRIVAAAESGRDINPELCLPFLNEGADAFRTAKELELGMVAGPLEGDVDSIETVPEDDQAALLESLTESVTLDALEPVANLALLFGVPTRFADAIGDLLARSDYRVAGEVSRPRLLGIFTGLALIAATTRSLPLSKAIFALLRNLDPSVGISAFDAFSIGMTAAAAHAQLSEWCHCVGTFFGEIGLRPLAREEAREWHGYLRDLCHLVPELWSTAANAEAALQSVGG